MKRFILAVFFFTICTLAIFALLLSFADGFTDEFYIRFTTPKKASIMLGTSRAAQGLQSSVFKEVLGHDMFNYAFTVYHSSYGPTYYESLKKKLDPKTKDGLFILAVDPWSISSVTEDPNDSLNFRELELSLGLTSYVNCKPNYSYLLQNLKGEFYKVLWTRHKNTFLHDDGWLEVNIEMDSLSVASRTKNKIRSYRENSLPKFHFSEVRLRYLEKIIDLLNEHGEVYIVRLPIHSEMLKIEDELMPDFDEKLKYLIAKSDGYMDMSMNSNSYKYTDGNHLAKSSSKVVSLEIAHWIKDR